MATRTWTLVKSLMRRRLLATKVKPEPPHSRPLARPRSRHQSHCSLHDLQPPPRSPSRTELDCTCVHRYHAVCPFHRHQQ